jgi:hypothetical protein
MKGQIFSKLLQETIIQAHKLEQWINKCDIVLPGVDHADNILSIASELTIQNSIEKACNLYWGWINGNNFKYSNIESLKKIDKKYGYLIKENINNAK